jgi:hypothetical protein
MSSEFALLLRSEIPDHEACLQTRQDAARQMGCRLREVSLHTFLIAPKVRAAEAYVKWFKALPPDVQATAVPPTVMGRLEYAEKVGPRLEIADPTSDLGIAKAATDFACGWRKLRRPPHHAVEAVFVPAPDRPNE